MLTEPGGISIYILRTCSGTWVPSAIGLLVPAIFGERARMEKELTHKVYRTGQVMVSVNRTWRNQYRACRGRWVLCIRGVVVLTVLSSVLV